MYDVIVLTKGLIKRGVYFQCAGIYTLVNIIINGFWGYL